ncbi:hypothetical protein [Methylocystis heyeri]|uniref:DUF748 domain-containing protein n=1 Tax=Methylocystis heyeri TaxID=391905 RepID=A0A6B8KA14_9HYPH|nr:hypothetical protein [Methylocystis heyeri]QGM44567.1 hypothetical protein H2LOC_002040 [Methylocystis heyeri]
MHILSKSAVMAAVSLAAFFRVAAGSAGEVAVEGLALDFGSVSFRIPRLAADGTTLTAAQIKESLRVGSAAALEERLAGLSASRLLIPEIYILAASKERRVELVYRDVALENIAAGRAASMRAASLEETVGGEGGGRIVARFSGIRAKGVDLRQIAHVAASPRADRAEAARDLEEEASIDSVSVALPDAGVELRAGKVSASGLRARALAEPLLRFAGAPAQASAPQAESAARGILDILGSFEAATIEARDLSLSGASGAEKKPYGVKIGSATLKKLAGGVSEEGRIEGFALEAADGGRVAFGRLAFRRLDFARLAAPGEQRPWMLSGAQLADLSADLPDSDSNGRLAFKVAAAEADLADFREGLPTRGSLRLDRFDLDLAALGDSTATAQFAALGYRNVELSANLKAEWLDRSKEAIVEQARIAAKDIGTLELTGRLGDVSGLVFSANPAVSRTAMLAMTARRLEITLEGGGLIDRLLAQEARASGADTASLRASYAGDVKKIVSAWLEDGDKARRIAEAAGKFIETPKRLRIILQSPKGVGLLEALARKPGDVLNTLEAQADAE